METRNSSLEFKFISFTSNPCWWVFRISDFSALITLKTGTLLPWIMGSHQLDLSKTFLMDVYYISFTTSTAEAIPVVSSRQKQAMVLHFYTLENAKSLFSEYFQHIAGRDFKNNPKAIELLDALIRSKPTILKIPADKASELINNWVQDYNLYQILPPVPPLNYDVMLMKPGFTAKFFEMDILKEIEKTLSINQDGNIVHTFFKIIDQAAVDQQKPLSKEEIINEIRKRNRP